MNGSFSEKTHYIFQGTEPIFEKRIKAGQTDKIRSYVYAGMKLIARVDGVIGSTTAKKYWYHTDHLGSVKAVTKEDGTLAWKADYFAFGQQYGKEKIDTTFEEDDLGFTGKGFDADIGLYYFNARWYDADTGRFISEDPVADPNNPNLYTYCRNNPVNVIDPTGLYGNPSDPGAMVGSTRPENAIDYGGGGNFGGSSGGSGGGPSSSGGQNNSGKDVPQSGPSTEEGPSLCAPVEGKDLTKDQPKTLSELKEQIEKDNPGVTVTVVDDHTIIIDKAIGIKETVTIKGLKMVVNGNKITIRQEFGSDQKGAFTNYVVQIEDNVSSISIGGSSKKVKTSTQTDKAIVQNLQDTTIGSPKANQSNANTVLVVSVTVRADGTVSARFSCSVSQGKTVLGLFGFIMSNGTVLRPDAISGGIFPQNTSNYTFQFMDVKFSKDGQVQGQLDLHISPPYPQPMVDAPPIAMDSMFFKMTF